MKYFPSNEQPGRKGRPKRRYLVPDDAAQITVYGRPGVLARYDTLHQLMDGAPDLATIRAIVYTRPLGWSNCQVFHNGVEIRVVDRTLSVSVEDGATHHVERLLGALLWYHHNGPKQWWPNLQYTYNLPQFRARKRLPRKLKKRLQKSSLGA